MPEPRYAIYFVPGAGTELYRFGASVLGYDCYASAPVALFGHADVSSWASIVREPAVYGFHATLKPPFYLAKGYGEADIEAAVSEFAASRPAVVVGELAVCELGSFIALAPKAKRPLLDQLAQACVRDFDHFRAPMSEQERVRRLTPSLSERQIENLYRWGYPYVFEDFRFHMTLTGSLALPKRSQAMRLLCDKFAQLPGASSLTVDQIVIARQADKASPFQVIKVASLG